MRLTRLTRLTRTKRLVRSSRLAGLILLVLPALPVILCPVILCMVFGLVSGLVSGVVWGQTPTNQYTATDSRALASTALTIQLSTTSPSRRVQMVAAYVYCSAQCTVAVERSGAAATATMISTTPTSKSTPPAAASVYGASDVGAGVVLGTYTHPGGNMTFDL